MDGVTGYPAVVLARAGAVFARQAKARGTDARLARLLRPPAHQRSSAPAPPVETCRVREVLEFVADKWSLYVVSYLGEQPRRFTELKRGIDGISQRMLTVTLRGLERDGILTRTVHEVMPPNVSYQLTALGRSLLTATAPLIDWSTENLPAIDAARARYEIRHASPSRGVVG